MHDEDNDGGFPGESPARRRRWLANEPRLSKGGFMYFWRSYLDPEWNHDIAALVRIWSVCWRPRRAGARGAGSRGIPARCTGWSRNRPLSGCISGTDLDVRRWLYLREVRDKYWGHDWRREHRGHGRYPENELWDAVEGYLDLLDGSRRQRSDA